MDLTTTVKEVLLAEFKQLYAIKGRKWRSVLKAYNNWHATDVGLFAWQNANKGTIGNEALRLIVTDMKSVLAKVDKGTIVKKQGLSKPKTL